MYDKNKNDNYMNKLTEEPLSYLESLNLAMNMEQIEQRRKELKCASGSAFESYLLFGSMTDFLLTALIMEIFDLDQDAIKPLFITIGIIYTIVFILIYVKIHRKK